jgi:hypothetical protein
MKTYVVLTCPRWIVESGDYNNKIIKELRNQPFVTEYTINTVNPDLILNCIREDEYVISVKQI